MTHTDLNSITMSDASQRRPKRTCVYTVRDFDVLTAQIAVAKQDGQLPATLRERL